MLEAGGADALFSVSYGYEIEAIDWINDVCAAHPDCWAMLCLHGYLHLGGLSSTGSYYIGPVIGACPNIRMVICGHERGTAYRLDTFDDDGDGTNERSVHQLLFNLQEEGDAGAGYLRMLRFDPMADTIEVVTYSPYLDDYGYEQPYGDGFGERRLLEEAGLAEYRAD